MPACIIITFQLAPHLLYGPHSAASVQWRNCTMDAKLHRTGSETLSHTRLRPSSASRFRSGLAISVKLPCGGRSWSSQGSKHAERAGDGACHQEWQRCLHPTGPTIQTDGGSTPPAGGEPATSQAMEQGTSGSSPGCHLVRRGDLPTPQRTRFSVPGLRADCCHLLQLRAAPSLL